MTNGLPVSREGPTVLERLIEAAHAIAEFLLSRNEVRRIHPDVLREFVSRKRALRRALDAMTNEVDQ